MPFFFCYVVSGENKSILSGIVHDLGIVFAVDTFSVPPVSNPSGTILCLGSWLVCQGVFLNVPALLSALCLSYAPASSRGCLHEFYPSPVYTYFLLLSLTGIVGRDKEGYLFSWFSLIFT